MGSRTPLDDTSKKWTSKTHQGDRKGVSRKDRAGLPQIQPDRRIPRPSDQQTNRPIKVTKVELKVRRIPSVSHNWAVGSWIEHLRLQDRSAVIIARQHVIESPTEPPVFRLVLFAAKIDRQGIPPVWMQLAWSLGSFVSSCHSGRVWIYYMSNEERMTTRIHSPSQRSRRLGSRPLIDSSHSTWIYEGKFRVGVYLPLSEGKLSRDSLKERTRLQSPFSSHPPTSGPRGSRWMTSRDEKRKSKC